MKVLLDKGGYIELINDFLDENECDKLFEYLITNMNWVRGTYMMFGRPVKTPRLLTSIMDNDFKVKMTGSVWNQNSEWIKASSEWSDIMLDLRNKIEKITGRKFMYCQLNHYEKKEDYIGWHSDSENNKGNIICSITLGANRRFLLREKGKKSGFDYEYILENGSLFIFDNDAANAKYKHCIAKVRKCDKYNDIYNKGRINITFRE